MKKYRQKEIAKFKAIQWTGDNTDEVIKFGTITIDGKDYHDIELDTYKPETYRNEEVRKYYETPRLIVSGCMYCGDIARIGNYLYQEGGEIYVMTEEEFETKFEIVDKDNHVAQSKEKTVIEAIKWTEDNSDEIVSILNGNGGFDADHKTIIIMNNFGGSVLMPGWYLLKYEDDFFASEPTAFEESWEEI